MEEKKRHQTQAEKQENQNKSRHIKKTQTNNERRMQKI